MKLPKSDGRYSMAAYVSDDRLDRLCTQLQETGTATDLPEYLLAAAARIGLETFTLTHLGVLLYRLEANRG